MMNAPTITTGEAVGLDVAVLGITADSREVRPGYLFAALPGSRTDGLAYVDEAVRRGASVVLVPEGSSPPALPAGVRLLVDADPRRCYALATARFYGRQPAHVVAVTGTNGKTSVAEFARQIWSHCGRRAASLGTLGIVAPELRLPLGLTTPEPVTLYRSLARLAADRVDHLAIEASSHGLDQRRLDGVRITAAAFTSFSRDHLDYHADERAYLDAKLRLFRDLLPAGSPVLVNADDRAATAVIEACRDSRHDVVTYGRGGLWLRLDDVRPDGEGQVLVLRAFGRSRTLRLPLMGGFQAGNALCAAGLAVVCGEAPEAALAAVETLEGVPGRLQLVARRAHGAPVFVDYAHTPDALSAALETLRPHVRGRIVVVFGCGGDRDPGKRPLMGEIAARHADRVIVTDDNPRSEPPAAIRHAIREGCPGAEDIGDRVTAIEAGVGGLGPDDLLLIAGKGHETGQIVGGRVLPFDDSAIARATVMAADAAATGGGRP